MSIEHLVICDRCGSVVAAASTVALARADAAQLRAQQDAREDLCACCATAGGPDVGDRHGDQHGGSAAHTAAASTPTKRLGDGLAELLHGFVCSAIDSRLAELSGGATGLADGEPGSAPRAFSERMSR